MCLLYVVVPVRRKDWWVSLVLVGLAVGIVAVGIAASSAGASAPATGPVHLPGDAAGPAGTETVSPGESPPPESLVQPGVQPSKLWPYTSRTRSVSGRTLAINVVVMGGENETRRILTERTAVNWTPVESDEDVDAGAGAAGPWHAARGAARYTYVRPANATSGTWVESTYQVGTGTYLGKRFHVRAYPSPTGNWTALQAHAEYWDWFRLRHTVTDISSAGAFVEADLDSEPSVRQISHEYHGRSGGWSDGWLIVAELATITVGASVLGDREETAWIRHGLVMGGAIVGIVLGVRGVGIAAETLAPSLSPKVIAGVLYPVLVVGPPLAVARFGRRRTPYRTAIVGVVALAVGIALDAASVGITHAPDTLVVHRVLLVTAFGILAVGVARRERWSIVAGVLAWLALLAAPLLGIM